jgi:hypothetical protein
MIKLLKILLLFLAGLIGISLIAALFVKKEYSVERSVNIDQPGNFVFDYIKFLKNQDNFSVWSKLDPGMKKEYRGTDGTAGFISAWDSQVKQAGKGEQEIIRIDEENRIDYEIRFLKPMKSTDNAYLALESVNDSTTNVKWGFFGKMNYPMNLMLVFMDMDEMLGKDLSDGLNNLKIILEKQ